MGDQVMAGFPVARRPGLFRVGAFLGMLIWSLNCPAQTSVPDTNAIRIVEFQGTVEVASAGAAVWTPVHKQRSLHPLDRIRTAAASRVALRWSDQSIVSFGASTELEILPPEAPGSQSGLHLIRGLLSFFHRDQPGRIRVLTRGAVAGVEGTEFVIAVNDAEATTLSVVDGRVRFGNDRATLVLTNGQQAILELGQEPVRTAGFIANNLLQWCFYYPAVLDPGELPLTEEELKTLAASLEAYRSGDVLQALARCPEIPAGASDGMWIYLAALLLSVGEVEKTEAILSAHATSAERSWRLSQALRQLIAAVKRQPPAMTRPPQLASEFLAQSYYEQAGAVRELSLKKALGLAREAAARAPESGFAWERVAELEFCFGRLPEAMAALNRSLSLAPRNAQALALRGFILLAQNKPREALARFNKALATDAALGNAWLGRGLSRIRTGNGPGGREDLLVAAALEPQRAELRSYLGKAYLAKRDDANAARELARAKGLDPKDPTAWLYSALQNQQNNRINAAIRDLEKSQALNDNRSVFRSQLLLDQDQSVRSANLASMYQDAGMADVSLREAGRAVTYDYANYSAHLFLANSYSQLRALNYGNDRYGTPSTSEFLVANLLAPANAGVMTPLMAQQPYTQLFDQNRVGVISESTYLSRGSWQESGAQYGVYDNFSYLFEADYYSDPGQTWNDSVENQTLSLTVKNQLTSQDSFFVWVQQHRQTAENLQDYYDPSLLKPSDDPLQRPPSPSHSEQTQNPNLQVGYHHEWGPGSHTLFLASRYTPHLTQSQSNTTQEAAAYFDGSFGGNAPLFLNVNAQIDWTIHSTELQQILQTAEHTTIVGTRFQWGSTHLKNTEDSNGSIDWNGWCGGLFGQTYPIMTDQDIDLNFYHYNGYAYHTWQIADPLTLTAGLDYDWLQEPANTASLPGTDKNKTKAQVSPKAGFIWTPAERTVVRSAYTRSLSGYGLAQSLRLEPTEVAGFNQAFRELIPPSVLGDTSGSTFDTADISIEQRFETGTYLALSGQLYYSQLDTLQGGFVLNEEDVNSDNQQPKPRGFQQTQNFCEKSVVLSVNQLLGEQWSAGALYRLSQAELDLKYPEFNFRDMYNLREPFYIRQTLESVLNTVNLHANWNHPCGLFSALDGSWYHQNNSGFTPAEPGDDFWKFNAFAGYRMWHRRVELTLGLLNIFDKGYKLEPLNFNNETAHSRTFLVRVRINF